MRRTLLVLALFLAGALTARRSLLSTAGTGGREGDLTGAIDLLDAAERAAGSQGSVPLRVWLHCCRAEDLAVLGQAQRALEDLDEAERLYASTSNIEMGFFDHWDRHRLDGWHASVLVHLGRGRDAAKILESVVAATPPNLTGPRAAVVADLGAACALDGQLERAEAHLLDALQVARQGQSHDGMARVRHIRRLHCPSGKPAALRQLDEALANQ